MASAMYDPGETQPVATRLSHELSDDGARYVRYLITLAYAEHLVACARVQHVGATLIEYAVESLTIPVDGISQISSHSVVVNMKTGEAFCSCGSRGYRVCAHMGSAYELMLREGTIFSSTLSRDFVPRELDVELVHWSHCVCGRCVHQLNAQRICVVCGTDSELI